MAPNGKTNGRPTAMLVSPKPVDQYPPVASHSVVLAERGFGVTLLTSPRVGRAEVEFNHPGVIVRAYPYSHLNGLHRLIALLKMIADVSRFRLLSSGPDLEIAYDPVGMWVATRALGQAKTSIHHFHEVLFSDEASRFEKAARLALAAPDFVTSADKHRAQLLKKTEPRPKEVLTLRNAPLQSQAINAAVKRRERFTAVYFGAMGEAQCLDSIIRSMENWPSDVDLDLFGSPSVTRRSTLARLAKEHGVEDRIHFRGWLAFENLIDAIATYHVGFSMLRPISEHWKFSAGASNKRFHMMCAGVPQITDNGVGVYELVEQNGVGVCVDPENPDEIAKQVRAYYNDRARIEREATAGRELIKGQLNMETEFQKVINRLRGMRGC